MEVIPFDASIDPDEIPWAEIHRQINVWMRRQFKANYYPNDVENCIQDAFVKLFRTIREAPETKVRNTYGYCHSNARYYYLNTLNRKGKIVYGLDELIAEVAYQDSRILDEIETVHMFDEWHEAFCRSQLTDLEQLTIRHKYFFNQSVQECIGYKGATKNQVYGAHARALAKLRNNESGLSKLGLI